MEMLLARPAEPATPIRSLRRKASLNLPSILLLRLYARCSVDAVQLERLMKKYHD
jgi:hypothetical protein